MIVATRFQEYPEGKGTYFLRGIDVHLNPGFFDGVIICSGPVTIGVRGFGDCRRCVIFATGPVEVDHVDHSIIVSDEDVTIKTRAKDSLIIARGKVTCKFEALDTQIVSGEKVVYGKYIKKERCLIRENEPNPLGFVQFFDPTHHGIMGRQRD